MTIQFVCQCGKQYKVADELAGKLAKCKHCGASITVPNPQPPVKEVAAKSDTGFPQINTGAVRLPAVDIGGGFPRVDTGRPKVQAEETPQISANAGSRAQAPSTSDSWHLYSHDGNQYGPISKAELDGWFNEGLITAACQIFREGAADWQPAADFYPQLSASGETATAASVRRSADAVFGSDYRPLLSATGKKKSMANMAINGELKKMPGTQLISSDMFNVGEPRTFMEKLKAGTIIGPIKISQMSISSMQLFHFRDPAGEFAMVLPFDSGMIAPCEYLALQKGCLPSALALLKQSGGKIALEASALTQGPVASLLKRIGTKVESIWVGCDGGLPPAAEAAQRLSQLSQGINWDGKVGGGPVSAVYHLDWGVQAVPLNRNSYLLVAQSVPKQKMIGFQFGVAWFRDYRKQFSQFVAGLNATDCGEFNFLDPGVWLSASVEALRWIKS